jgi:hypothetical protein
VKKGSRSITGTASATFFGFELALVEGALEANDRYADVKIQHAKRTSEILEDGAKQKEKRNRKPGRRRNGSKSPV